MEPENIGIGRIIKEAQNNPDKYAEIIARRVVRLIIKKLDIAEQEGQALSDDQLVAVADRIPSQKQIEKISPLVIQLIQEHAMGAASSTETEVGAPKKKPIHESMRNLVSRACMQLLADQIHTHTELAHYIHDNPDLSIRILHQPERRTIFEHGVIPKNRTFHDIGTEDTQLWTGHDTQRKHMPSNGIKNDNIIMLLQRDIKGDDFKISPILRGENIKIFGDQVLVFRDRKIYVHNGPEMGIDDFPLLSEFPCDFESIENIEYLKTKSEWHMYRITGTKNIEEVNEESTSITSSITLCVNEDRPELSYSTTSKRFLMGGNGFTVDTTNGVIIAFTRGNTVRIPYSEIHGMKKEGNGEEYFVFNQDGIQKKLTFSSGNPEVSDIAE